MEKKETAQDTYIQAKRNELMFCAQYKATMCICNNVSDCLRNTTLPTLSCEAP